MIRPAVVADARGVAEVRIQTWRSAYRGIVPDAHLDAMVVDEKAVDKTRSWLEQPGDRKAFVALADGGIVGFAVGGPQRNRGNVALPFTGELYAIYILAEHQGAGHGRVLVRAIADHLHAHGMDSLSVWVLEHGPARKFYERLGGRLLEQTADIELAGTRLIEVGYGWPDTTALRSPS